MHPIVRRAASAVFAFVSLSIHAAAQPADDATVQVHARDTRRTAASPALATMQRYLELINTGHFAEVGDLFTEDAEFLTPTGETLRGREAVRAFYRDELSKLAPVSHMGRAVADGPRCAFELEGHSTTYPALPGHTVVDFVDVDGNGKIRRLAVYTREHIESAAEAAERR